MSRDGPSRRSLRPLILLGGPMGPTIGTHESRRRFLNNPTAFKEYGRYLRRLSYCLLHHVHLAEIATAVSLLIRSKCNLNVTAIIKFYLAMS